MTSKSFMVNGIRNLLKRNYDIEKDIIDIEAEVDSTLTFQENWSIIKELGKVLTPAILTWLATQNPIWTVVITAFAKALFDIAEYYVRVYK